MAQPFNVEPRIDIDAAAFCLDTTLWTSEQLGAFVELMATLVVSRDRAGTRSTTFRRCAAHATG